ncbi:MAG: hypothetical protein ACI9J5_002977, partial [Paraglaciecola sp.]
AESVSRRLRHSDPRIVEVIFIHSDDQQQVVAGLVK